MTIRTPTIEERLGSDYMNHGVFNSLETYAEFYKSLSFGIMNFISMGTPSIINIDTYTYSSMQGTLESVLLVLKKGRINDAYSLLRKFFDVSIINVYTNLYLKKNFSIDNFIVTEIDDWVKGKKKIPYYREMFRYIMESEELNSMTELLRNSDRYKTIRDRCNDYTHYNFYHNLMANDNEIYRLNRIRKLDVFKFDLDNIFIQHFAYIFTLNEHYMTSSDYMDSLDVGVSPIEGSQYWVAPYIQDIFDSVISNERKDIAEYMKNNTGMELG